MGNKQGKSGKGKASSKSDPPKEDKPEKDKGGASSKAPAKAETPPPEVKEIKKSTAAAPPPPEPPKKEIVEVKNEVADEIVSGFESSKKVVQEDFELLAVIGRGSFGKVMQVKHRSTGKIYAK